MGEVEIGAGAIADVHGLAKALLGVVSVEDDAVEDNGDAFENNFNQATNERPTLWLLISNLSRV